MTIHENKLINVLNFNENPVSITTHKKEYLCSAMEGNQPSVLPLPFSEVESLNSNSNAFKLGTLRFPKEIEKEVYEALTILDWEDILTNEKIEEIILHPSLDGISKLVEIKNVSLFERVRGVFFSLKNSNAHDISTRVERIILERYKELCVGKIHSSIIIRIEDTATPTTNLEVNSLKEQNQSLQKQMEEMQAMLKQFMTQQNSTVNETDSSINVEETPTNETTPKRGRPKTKA